MRQVEQKEYGKNYHMEEDKKKYQGDLKVLNFRTVEPGYKNAEASKAFPSKCKNLTVARIQQI